MNGLFPLVFLTFRGTIRDRVLHAVLGVAFLMVFLVPVLSYFSMRQVQELAITLSLSAISFVLLVISLLLGASSVWRDIERRYTASILTLPISRGHYVIGKFLGAAIFIIFCALILGLSSVLVIKLAASRYPSDIPIYWLNYAIAVVADLAKYILLTSFALLLSSVSTSFFLPFFCTTAIYFAGSGSQEVFEYISSELGKGVSPLSLLAIKFAYYVLPNLSAFNYKVHAIYGLPIDPQGLLYTFLYFVVYTAILLSIAVWSFSRRQLS